MRSRNCSWFRAGPQQPANPNADRERCTKRCGGRQPPGTPSMHVFALRKFAGCAHGLQPSEGLLCGVCLRLSIKRGLAALLLVEAGMSRVRGSGLLDSPPSFGCTLYVVQEFAQPVSRPDSVVLTSSLSLLQDQRRRSALLQFIPSNAASSIEPPYGHLTVVFYASGGKQKFPECRLNQEKRILIHDEFHLWTVS